MHHFGIAHPGATRAEEDATGGWGKGVSTGGVHRDPVAVLAEDGGREGQNVGRLDGGAKLNTHESIEDWSPDGDHCVDHCLRCPGPGGMPGYLCPDKAVSCAEFRMNRGAAEINLSGGIHRRLIENGESHREQFQYRFRSQRGNKSAEAAGSGRLVECQRDRVIGPLS